jgi:hypothetical protein
MVYRALFDQDWYGIVFALTEVDAYSLSIARGPGVTEENRSESDKQRSPGTVSVLEDTGRQERSQRWSTYTL